MNAECRFLNAQAQRFGHARDCGAGRAEVQLHAAAQEEPGVVVAENQVRICDGRFGSAHPVAGRPGIGTGRMRSDFQQANLVDGCNGAAAGANLDHFDHRRLDRQAGSLGKAVNTRRFHHRGDFGAAILDHAGLGGGAAHVERDHIGQARAFGKQRRRQPAAGRPAFEKSDREVTRGFQRNKPACGMHQPQRTRKTFLVQRLFQFGQIPVHQGLHEGVGAGGDTALVFAHLGHDIARNRDRDGGKFLANDFGGAAFMFRVRIGMQKDNRNCLAALRNQFLRGGAYRVFIKRCDDFTGRGDALGHFQPEIPAHERVRKSDEQIVDIIPLLGSHLQDVTETARRDQPNGGAFALDHRIRDQRRTVHDLRYVSVRNVLQGKQFFKALERRLRRIVRCGEALVQRDRGILTVVEDKVSKGASNIEADAPAGFGCGHAGYPFCGILRATKPVSPSSSAMRVAPAASAASISSRVSRSTTACG